MSQTLLNFLDMSWTCPICPESLAISRSEEHTSELQSHVNLVCRLLLEKKKKRKDKYKLKKKRKTIRHNVIARIRAANDISLPMLLHPGTAAGGECNAADSSQPISAHVV